MFEEAAALILSKGIPYSLMAVTALILFDTLFGVLASVKVGDFDVEKMKQFVATNLLPYIGGLGLLALGAMFVSAELFGAAYSLSVTVVVIGYLKSLYAKLQTLFSVQFIYDCIECGESFPYTEEAYSVTPGPVCPDCQASHAEGESGGE